MKTKCIFLDRDGVLNEDPQNYYLYKPEEMVVPEGVVEGLKKLKKAGYLLIVVTNQAGIAKKIYERQDVWNCHNYFQKLCGNLLDDLYFCPHHPDHNSDSLLRKPNSLMLEKAIAKHNIDVAQSWMVGDRQRDVEAGAKAGVKTVLLSNDVLNQTADYHATNFESVVRTVTKS